MHYAYFTADVFTHKTFSGAQIAVLPEADGLDAPTMQAIATELNLSETVFVFKPRTANGNRRIRVFNPHREIDFAGHPIIAAGHVLAATGRVELPAEHTVLRLEQNRGPIDVTITRGDGAPVMIQFALTVRPVVDRFVPPVDQIAQMLSLRPSDLAVRKYRPLIVYTEQSYLIVPCTNYEAVHAARFNYQSWSRSTAPSSMANEVLLFSACTPPAVSNFHARLVGPAIGVNEDPPVGTAMPAFAAYFCAHEDMQRGTHTFVVDRGSSAGRLSLLHIEMDHGGESALPVRIGGPAVLVCEGRIRVPPHPGASG